MIDWPLISSSSLSLEYKKSFSGQDQAEFGAESSPVKGLSALVPQLSKGMLLQALCTRGAVVKMSDRVTPPIQVRKLSTSPSLPGLSFGSALPLRPPGQGLILPGRLGLS